MDKSIVAAEDSCEGNEPLGSTVQINSIAINLDCAMGETTQSLTHEHFSILGFTAEMRKKDRKVCFPFASESGDNMNLPPLPVPKFRYWQCMDCILDAESTSEVIVTAKSGAGSSSVHNTVEENDGLQIVQNIDVRNSEGGNVFPNQVQTKQMTPNNSADENPSTGPHNLGKTSSLSDGDIPFSSVPPKRKPKLRYLADIIKGDENSIPAQRIEPELDPQARIDAPNNGATKTLRRRKKIVLEDEEEEIDHPIPTAKISKGPIIELNNNNITSRCIEISESESERDNSRPLQFDSRMSAKTDQNKVRKQRSLDMNRKNIHKDPPVVAGASIGDTCPFFKNSLFGEQMHGIYDMSKGKRVDEGGYSPYKPPPSNNGSLGVCNNHEKVALDLSLSSYKGSGVTNFEKQECSRRHTEIPDLNESFVEKTSMTEEHQLPTLHENSYMFLSSGKNTNTVEVEPAGKASDDIPMEIVELLAKNQHDRSLTNSRKAVTQSNNPFKVVSPYANYYANYGGSSSVSSGSMGFSNFPLSKNCDSNWGQFRQFGPPTAAQHRTELHSGPMNRSRLSDSADLLWPPRRKNMSFDISKPSGLEDQSCKAKNMSMDAYSNDTIPAMQLLSLMDQRNVSGSSFKHGGPNNFLDRQFSPCNHHPRQISKNGTNDFPTLLNGARCSCNFGSMNIFSLDHVPPHKGNSKPVDLVGPSYRPTRPWRSNPASEVLHAQSEPC